MFALACMCCYETLTARTHHTIREEEVRGHMIVIAQTTTLAYNFSCWSETAIGIGRVPESPSQVSF